MKKVFAKILSICIVIIVVLFLFKTFSYADVGSFDRYDSGSSWSSGSSSWDSGSYSRRSSSSSSYDSIGDSDLGFIFGFLFGNGFSRSSLIIVAIFIIVRYFIKRSKNKSNPLYNQNKNNNNSSAYTTNVHDVGITHIHTDEIKKIDPNFSEEKILEWAKDLYVKLQNAWTERNWEPMRPFETQNLFEQHNAQIQNYINTNRINVVDRIAVDYATIYNFRQEGDRDILEIALKATKKDYIIDATTKELLEGSMTQDRITVYKMTFERKTGVLTPEGTDELKTTNCPNCGAPTEITSAGKCNYCGCVITTGANTWVLSGLEPLKN